MIKEHILNKQQSKNLRIPGIKNTPRTKTSEFQNLKNQQGKYIQTQKNQPNNHQTKNSKPPIEHQIKIEKNENPIHET